MLRSLCTLLAASLLLAPAAAAADEPEATQRSAVERAVERIRLLERQIEQVLADLDPEERRAVQERLAEARDDPGAPASSAPPASPAPALVRPADVPPAPGTPRARSGPTPRGETSPTPPADAPAPAPPDAATDPAPGTEAGAACSLAPLDFDGDGEIRGADRYWRYLHVWLDDRDGAMEPGETPTLYEAGVRSLAVDLSGYTNDEKGSGDVVVHRGILLELPSPSGGGLVEAPLLLDAGALARGDDLRLVDADGRSLDGLQPLTRDLSFLHLADRRTIPLACR